MLDVFLPAYRHFGMIVGVGLHFKRKEFLSSLQEAQPPWTFQFKTSELILFWNGLYKLK